MDWINSLDRFELDDNLFLNKQVESITDFDENVVIADRKFNLRTSTSIPPL